MTTQSTDINRSFFAQDTLTVARGLLGVQLQYADCKGIIVETEAYAGDPASHAFTRPRTGAMLRETFGCVYIYQIYGMHRCLNFTSDDSGPGAVLIRALEPLEGIESMMARRGTDRLRNLTSGPAKLVQALAVDPAVHGQEVGGSIRLRRVWEVEETDVATGPRIGISKAQELPWRFWVKGNAHVSR